MRVKKVNPGNTGQRFKQSKVLDVEAKGNHTFLVKMECGHDYTVVDSWIGMEAALRDRIGKRQRCNHCR